MKRPDPDSIGGSFLDLLKSWRNFARVTSFMETRKRTLNGERLELLTPGQRAEAGVMAPFRFALYSTFLTALPANVLIAVSTFIWDRPVAPVPPPMWLPSDAAAAFSTLMPTVSGRLRPFILPVYIVLLGLSVAWQYSRMNPNASASNVRNAYWYLNGSDFSRPYLVFIAALSVLLALPLTEERAAASGDELTSIHFLIVALLYICWWSFWRSVSLSSQFLTPRMLEVAQVDAGKTRPTREVWVGVAIEVVTTIVLGFFAFYALELVSTIVAAMVAIVQTKLRGWIG